MPSYNPNVEPVVKVSSPLPKGYIFVPKGDVYITGNCRRQTQAAKQTVYAVVNHQRKSVGIRVPAAVHARVLQDERASRADRASTVQRRDAALEKQFRDAILSQFPQTPAADVPLVVRRAMLKGSGRVGRTGKLDIKTKAKLAVRAHIRHVHTEYDNMLRAKTHNKGKARDETLSKVNEIADSWGGKAEGRRPHKPGKSRDRRKKAKAEGEVKGEVKAEIKGTAKQGPKTKETRSSRRRSSLVKNKSPMQVKKLQVRLARQDGSNSAKVQIGKSLRQHSSDSDEMDDESDEFEWLESDDDSEDSDSEWADD
ncbi:hypothetical protein PG994_009526 [Apiospora phragmitis]|uniref:DUF2293 domain-containing protein n=1 Tax=Apiospora phragmitis TaxID=2905665 RepID=A0ABR1U6D8_9PEZI